MFTGIVTDVGTIARIDAGPDRRRVRIACAYPVEEIALGASIACGGPCLTVVAKETASGQGISGWFEVDVGAETLARTTAGAWVNGTRLNLERSLKLGDELGGHMVLGHIDGIATIEKIEPLDEMSRLTIRAPSALARFIAEKGSVALDGTSLTVNEVDGDTFGVFLIPHTLAITTWGERKAGDSLNLEVDLMARYIARLSQPR